MAQLGRLTERPKIDLLTEKADGLLGDLSDRSLIDKPSFVAARLLRIEGGQTPPAYTELQEGVTSGHLLESAGPVGLRRRFAGPRRLQPAGLGPVNTVEDESGDLGGQFLRPTSTSSLPSVGAHEVGGRINNVRILPVRRRAAASVAEQPVLLEVLTTLLSPKEPGPTVPPKIADEFADLPATSLVGLGIAHSQVTGLGISDLAHSAMPSIAVLEAAPPQPASLSSGDLYKALPALVNHDVVDGLLKPVISAIEDVVKTPTSLPDLLDRRSNSRLARGIRRRSVASEGPMPQYQQASSFAVSSAYQSPSSAFSPSPSYIPSPLSNEWPSPSPSSAYSPMSSPVPTFGSSPFFEFKASQSTSTCCPPNGTATASPIATSPAQMSPIVMASPLLTTPVMADSPIFSSPVFATDTEAFETTMSHRTAAEPSGTFYAANASGPPSNNNSFYTMQAVMSALLAIALFFAFLWAWLAWLAKRRKPKQLPYISGPMPYLEYKPAADPDDDVESRYGTARNTSRSSEVPTLPESVLPTRLWRNSTASASGGMSEFRKSVEEGLESVGVTRPSSLPVKQRQSIASLQLADPQRASKHHRSQTMDYRSTRMSRNSDTAKVPVPPPASYLAFDRADTARPPSVAVQTEPLTLRKTAKSAGQHLPPLSPSSPLADEVSKSIIDLTEARPVSPTESTRSKTSTKSSKSMKQALWALRKTAIIASASSSGKKEAKPMEISMPIGRPKETTIYATDLPNDNSASVDLSDSINVVMFDVEAEEAGRDTLSTTPRSRPISQESLLPKSKLRKRSSSLGASKARPSTIGSTPPAIFVTDHPQALVPPPSPKVKRMSAYSLTDTLPYTISASPSLATTSISQYRDDVSIIDPAGPRPDSELFFPASPEHAHSADASRHDSVQSTGSLASESAKSVDSMDLATDEEQLRRSQRRRTLLYSVYRQSQSHPTGLSDCTNDTTRQVKATVEPATPTETPKRPQKPRPTFTNVMHGAHQLPPTPPHTPVESRFPTPVSLPASVQTPTKRGRSVSAGGAAKPILDASLTRFSRLDLASEFSMSQFDSQSSLRSAKKGDERLVSLPSSPPSRNLVGASASANLAGRSARRRSVITGTDGASNHTNETGPVATATRRTRSSTVGDKPVAMLAAEAMLRDRAAPMPIISKATRVSVAPATSTTPPLPATRSIAQDLRASVSFPSSFDRADTRPSSFRTSYSSFGTSDHRRSSIFDMATYASEFPQYIPPSPKLNMRISNGSLGLPRGDDEEDDDRSVYSRDSGSHESAWELAKARVRARASLALPSVREEEII